MEKYGKSDFSLHGEICYHRYKSQYQVTHSPRQTCLHSVLKPYQVDNTDQNKQFCHTPLPNPC